MISEVKQCEGKCKQSFPETSEYFPTRKDNRVKTGVKITLRNVCRVCYRSLQKDWRESENGKLLRRQFDENPINREKRLVREKRWRFFNIEKYLWNAAKYRAKRFGLEFSIKLQDIVVPENCPVLNIPLFKIDNGSENSPSIDRIDSNKGYTPSNIKVISWKANTIKNFGTADEHEAIAKYIRENDLQSKSSLVNDDRK